MEIFMIFALLTCSSVAFGEDRVIHTDQYYGGETTKVGDFDEIVAGVVVGNVATQLLKNIINPPVIVNRTYYPPVYRQPVIIQRDYIIYGQASPYSYGWLNHPHRHYKRHRPHRIHQRHW